MINHKLSKKAQHETLGFVLIVLIIVVMGVVFLGISLRQKPTVSTTDAEIANFLDASSGVTTACYTNSEPYYRPLGQLVGDCYKTETTGATVSCPNSSSPCKVLDDTYSSLMQYFRPGGTPLSYYKLSFFINSSSSTNLIPVASVISYGTSAKCTLIRAGMNPISSTEGWEAIEELEICPNA